MLQEWRAPAIFHTPLPNSGEKGLPQLEGKLFLTIMGIAMNDQGALVL